RVHGVEIAGDDLRAWVTLQRLDHRRELFDAVLAVDARVEVYVHGADGTVGRPHGCEQRNPASRSEVKLMSCERVHPDVLERIPAHDRQSLRLSTVQTIRGRVGEVKAEACADVSGECGAIERE